MTRRTWELLCIAMIAGTPDEIAQASRAVVEDQCYTDAAMFVHKCRLNRTAGEAKCRRLAEALKEENALPRLRIEVIGQMN